VPVPVPESSSVLGLLALGLLGTAAALKRHWN
nr:PEP-CTERM sorting domain-containing protein [Microcystis aeruginosa SX13-01]